MIVQGKDGELRLNDQGLSGTTYYVEVLFCEMDFSGPTSRPRTDETLIMDRGKFDSWAHYIQSNDEPRYAPLNISFSCKLADILRTRAILDWVSGVTKLAGTTQLYSRKGKTTIDSNTLPNFADSTGKAAYDVEILWAGPSGSSIAYRYYEVYFPPGEQTIAESADGIVLSVAGKVYGDVTRILNFSTGYTHI